MGCPGDLAAPVTRIGLAPRSDALDLGGTFEVIAVFRLLVPSPLAGGFAGLSALGPGTVALAPDTAPVGNKEGLAMLTFTLWGLTCHRPESPQVHDQGVGTWTEENRQEKMAKEEGRKGVVSKVGEENGTGLTYILSPPV